MTVLRYTVGVNKLAQAKYGKSAVEMLQIKWVMSAPAFSQKGKLTLGPRGRSLLPPVPAEGDNSHCACTSKAAANLGEGFVFERSQA